MSEYNSSNYKKPGGDETVIGGTLTVNGTLAIAEGATVTGLAAAAQADSTATDAAGIVTDFNALLSKLRTAGLLAST